MKGLFSKLVVLSFVLFVVFGCNLSERIQKAVQGDKQNNSSNQAQSNSDNYSNSSAEDTEKENLELKKTGIPECDELVDVLVNKNKENPDEEQSWQNRAFEEVIKRQVYDQLNKDNANKSPKEKAEMAKGCKMALDMFKDQPKQ